MITMLQDVKVPKAMNNAGDTKGHSLPIEEIKQNDLVCKIVICTYIFYPRLATDIIVVRNNTLTCKYYINQLQVTKPAQPTSPSSILATPVTSDKGKGPEKSKSVSTTTASLKKKL